MITDLDHAVHLAALRNGFGLPQERLARMAAARAMTTLTAFRTGRSVDGTSETQVDVDAFECIDAAAAIEAPFVVEAQRLVSDCSAQA